MNRLPYWFRQSIPDKNLLQQRLTYFKNLGLNTICENARCPNISDCFQRKTATFMILGDICTRSCNFCAVKKGIPPPVDVNEPTNLALAIKEMALGYVVITSVTRDDLTDRGASQFLRCVEEIHKLCPETKIELLIPDFAGIKENLDIVVQAKPDVIAHNLETVPRFYKLARPEADYKRSLEVIRLIKLMDKSIYTKSGLMLGLGERQDELIDVFTDLHNVNCDFLTLGQYLAPSSKHLKVERFFSIEEFKYYQTIALSMGFKYVSAGPLVRSSYLAEEIFEKCLM